MICEDMHDLMTQSHAGSAWMGLDLGTKTIGVAVSDRLLSCATPLHTIRRVKFSKDAEALLQIIENREIGAVILGLPRNIKSRNRCSNLGPAAQHGWIRRPAMPINPSLCSQSSKLDQSADWLLGRAPIHCGRRTGLARGGYVSQTSCRGHRYRRSRLYLTGRSRSCATYSGGAIKVQNIDDIWKRDEIDSPCIKLCSIHPGERICIGCYRSIEEIGSWSQLSPEQRREIMADLLDRAPRVQKRRGGRASRPPNLG